MRPPSPAAWAEHLRRVAGDLPPPGSKLGAGEVDEPLLASAAGRVIGVPPQWTEPLVPPGNTTPSPEARLWWIVHQPRAALEPVLDPLGTGPLIAPECHRAIEVWTECELCALHALGRIVSMRADRSDRTIGPWLARVDAARRWHLEHTQPDNATTRPWAIAVFASDPSLDSQLYAQTLLHNALVAAARPAGAPPPADAWNARVEPLAGVILTDAAGLLDRSWRRT